MPRSFWIGTVALLAACLPGPALAQLDIVADAWPDPAADIYDGDRVTVRWTFSGAPADSLRLDFHDGTSVGCGAGVTETVHVYAVPGVYDLDIRAWRDGVQSVYRARSFASVQQRPFVGSNLMFVHHSTGRYLLRDSGIRSLVGYATQSKGATVRFWDHDYHSGNTYTGIIDPDSTVFRSWSYGTEANDITPYGYHQIFTTQNAFRDSLLSRHDVIVFKNDHGTGDIASQAQLDAYKQWVLATRDVFDQHPDKLFVYVSGPPRRPEDSGGIDEADRAREFYDWLASPEVLNGHPNLVYFDLFSMLAAADDPADPERNLLRPEYREGPDGNTDSHPNSLANITIGPVFAAFLTELVTPPTTTDAPAAPAALASVVLRPNTPNPFNPATVIRFDLRRDGLVGLRIFDLSGRRIRTILEPTWLRADSHAYRWDGRDDGGRNMPSGVYVFRIETPAGAAGRRMTLVR